MYCYNCGTNIGTDKNFCPECGANQIPEAPAAETEQTLQAPQAPPAPDENIIQPVYYQPSYDMPMQETKKSKKWIWITAVSAAAVIIIASLAVYFIFFSNVSHMMKIGRALANLSAESDERNKNSPLKAFVMLPEIMEDGTIKANVEYSYDLFGNMFGTDIEVDILFSSNMAEREYALKIEEASSGIFNEIDLYMNSERLALRLDVLDNNFYGIRYDTFREDIRVFGRLIMLDDEVMDFLSDIVDIINEIINFEETDDLQKAYMDAFVRFAGNLKSSSSKKTLESAGESVRCTAIELSITKDDILTLIKDIYEIYETSETFQAQYDIFDNSAFSGLFYGLYGESFYEDFLKNSRDYIDSFEKTYEGDIRITFFIGSGDRLLSVAAKADTKYEGEETSFEISSFFGNSIEDDWIFDFTSDDSQSVKVIWSYSKQSGNFVNTVNIEVDNTSVVLKSTLDESGGRFKLSYDAGSLSRGEITGIFTSDDDSFRLAFDNLLSEHTGGRLLIDLSAEPGSDISEIDYINIDKWGQALLDSLTRLLFSQMFRG